MNTPERITNLLRKHNQIGPWIIIFLLSTVFAFINATIIYDDLYLLQLFQTLKDSKDLTQTILYIFFSTDLGTKEFRLYGGSRVFHYLLWELFGNHAIFYTLFIAWSQVATAYLISRIFAKMGHSNIQSSTAGCIWALSPFAVTSCFHHYSYLILPWQIAIILVSTLLKTGILPPIRYAVFTSLGSLMGLTGESHLIGVSLLLLFVALGFSPAQGRKGLSDFGIIIASTIFTIAAYSWARSLLVIGSSEERRYTFAMPTVAEIYDRNVIFAKSIYLGIISQLEPLFSVAQGWSILTLTIAIAFTVWCISRSDEDTLGTAPSPSLWLLLVFLGSLVVVWLLSMTTGQVSIVLPRRYGYVTNTLGLLVAITFIIRQTERTRLGRLGALTVVAPVWVWFTLQAVALPTIRKEDSRIWNLVEDAVSAKEHPALLFMTSWSKRQEADTEFDKFAVGLRGSIPEIFESKLSNYLWQGFNAYLIPGVKFSGGTAKSLGDVIELGGAGRLYPKSYLTPRSEIVVVENISESEPSWTVASQFIRVFPTWEESRLPTLVRYEESNISPPDVEGHWRAGAGQGTIQAGQEGTLKITTETGVVTHGRIEGNALVCKDWHVSAYVSTDKKTLRWSNGFKWTR